VIRLLWLDGMKTGEIYRRMTLHYGDNSVSQRKEGGRVLLHVLDEH